LTVLVHAQTKGETQLRTKISAVIAAVVLAATAATIIAANLYGAVATAAPPVQGDPIPGIEVSIEQSPGGIIATQGSTGANGTLQMNVGPGEYLLTIDPFTPTSKAFRSKKVQVMNILIEGGETTIFETWDFSGRCLYTKKFRIPPGPTRTIKVLLVEGRPCEPAPTPR
jgi:hypothetical protein